MTPQDILDAIAALETALASGELTVEYAGRRVTFRAADELIKALAHFTARRDAPTPGSAAPSAQSRTTYASFARD